MSDVIIYNCLHLTLVRNSATLILLTAALLVVSCKRDSAQDRFEREAFAPPENFTRTNANGDILQRDPDDWRIAPMFEGIVEILSPAYPNPSTGNRFTIELIVTGFDALNGLEVYTRNEFGIPFIIYNDSRRPIPPGIVDIFIEPAWLVTTRTYSAAIGLHRIFIYDSTGNMITYGDLMVE